MLVIIVKGNGTCTDILLDSLKFGRLVLQKFVGSSNACWSKLFTVKKFIAESLNVPCESCK